MATIKGASAGSISIVLANECGKDLYVCLPMEADNAYLEQFAHWCAMVPTALYPTTTRLPARSGRR